MHRFPSLFKKRNKRKNFFRAETLVEVVIALFVVAIGSATATSLIISALQSNSFSRDNLIALNLATEGLEAMRNIRDTNWLRFGFNKAECWNMIPNVANCTSGGHISGRYYTVDLDVNNMQWSLTQSSQGLDLSSGGLAANEIFRLKFVDLDGIGGNDHDLYISNQVKPALPAVISGDSNFFRMIEIDYPNNADPAMADEMTVISKVAWKSQGAVHQVVLATKLTNYLKTEVNL